MIVFKTVFIESMRGIAKFSWIENLFILDKKTIYLYN